MTEKTQLIIPTTPPLNRQFLGRLKPAQETSASQTADKPSASGSSAVQTRVDHAHSLEYVSGDLLESDEFYIMHGCNNQGFMESGIAAQIKKKYPIVYQEYRRHHELTGLRLGSFHLVDVNPERRVINAITQTQGGIPVSYDAINQIFTDLNTVNLNPHKRIAIPKIGAGVAGGSWDIIESIIKARAVKYGVCVYVYDPT